MTERVVITGADGFLGWHVRVLAHAMGIPAVVPVGRDSLMDQASLAAALDGADRVVHLAGVNRGSDDEFRSGNLRAAAALAQGIRGCAAPPKTVVFANSVRAGDGTAYGDAKAAAAEVLAEAASWSGAAFVDERLPNVFGEHGRPRYHSVVATFCHLLADGGTPEVDQDRELDLLHATDAAAVLLGQGQDPSTVRRVTVRWLEERLRHFATVYRTGELPDLTDRFDVRLFNTYRSYCFPGHYPVVLPRHGDHRGELAETVRVRGGGGQLLCSSTRPGMTRGDHYHMARVERLAVVSGEAEISLRRLLCDGVVRFRVSGDEPVAVDMPVMWAHTVANIGDRDVVTVVWSNDPHDSQRSDTYLERVLPA